MHFVTEHALLHFITLTEIWIIVISCAVICTCFIPYKDRHLAMYYAIIVYNMHARLYSVCYMHTDCNMYVFIFGYYSVLMYPVYNLCYDYTLP